MISLGVKKRVPKKPAFNDFPPAFRIGVSIGIPLVILKLTGHLDWTLYAIFGGYTSTYGRTASHIDRFKMQAAAGNLIVISLTAGTIIGAELFALKHYGMAMVFMTPMALLMTQLNVKHISTSLVLDQGITTGIGVAIGLSVLYLTND